MYYLQLEILKHAYKPNKELRYIQTGSDLYRQVWTIPWQRPKHVLNVMHIHKTTDCNISLKYFEDIMKHIWYKGLGKISLEFNWINIEDIYKIKISSQ